MLIIPIDTSVSANISKSVNVGEMVCKLELLWNERGQNWFFNCTTSAGARCGIVLVENYPLLGSKSAVGLDGDFRVIKVNESCKTPINYENLGVDYNLVFGTEEEWEEVDGV